MESGVLKIQMLGDFSLSYNNKPIILERSNSTKATQLMQFLVYHADESIPRDTLINMLYSQDDINSPSNNLKVNLFRLRKLLSASHLPQDEYISFKSKTYRFNSVVPIEIDCKRFEDLVLRSKDSYITYEEKLFFIRQAIDIYKGEFLPMVSTVPWVIVENIKFYQLYSYCINEAYTMLKETGNFKSLLEICTAATDIYPYDENFQLLKISCLIDMKQFNDAKMLYNEISKRFFEDLGISPSEKMLNLYKSLVDNIKLNNSTISEIKELLREKESPKGAYYCNYLGFVDSYRFIARTIERSGQSIFLTLLTLTNTHGVPLSPGEHLNKAADILHNVIGSCLRRGDLYTQYSPNQFLILLMGINYENCAIVTSRIETDFKNRKLRAVRLDTESISGAYVEGNSDTFSTEFLNRQKW